MKFKVAIVGAGYMAREHLRVLSASREFEVVGIFSQTYEKAVALANQEGIQYVASSISDLFKKTQAQVVLVAVPEMSTEKVCLEVYDHPWISLVEKPVGYNLEIAERISSECTRLHRRSYVALNRRYFDSTIKLEESAQRLQGMRYLRIIDQEDTEAAAKANQPLDVIQNWMFANSIHIIDYIQLLMRGKVVSKTVTDDSLGGSVRILSAQLYYDSGDRVDYRGLWNTPGSWSVNLHIGQTEFEARPLEVLGTRTLGQRGFHHFSFGSDDSDFKPGLKKMWDDMSNLLNSRSTRLVSVSDSLELMRTIRLIYGDE